MRLDDESEVAALFQKSEQKEKKPTVKDIQKQEKLMPKKPRTSFVFFMKDNKNDEASSDLSQLSTKKPSRLNRIGKKWRRISPDEKQKYSDLALKDNQRYKREIS